MLLPCSSSLSSRDRSPRRELLVQRMLEKCTEGFRRSGSVWVFRSLAKGIQGVFVGYSGGIRVPKRVFRNTTAMEPMKTFGFWAHASCDGDTELPFYNIKKGKQRPAALEQRSASLQRARARSWALAFYRSCVVFGLAWDFTAGPCLHCLENF